MSQDEPPSSHVAQQRDESQNALKALWPFSPPAEDAHVGLTQRSLRIRQPGWSTAAPAHPTTQLNKPFTTTSHFHRPKPHGFGSMGHHIRRGVACVRRTDGTSWCSHNQNMGPFSEIPPQRNVARTSSSAPGQRTAQDSRQ